ncbi:MAG TPA: hypothetical protein VGL93_31715 [Streptosporangiaceae bacterium]
MTAGRARGRDVAGLMDFMDRLVGGGNTVLVIEQYACTPAGLLAHPASASASHLRRDLA